jgi:hypothetical protein
MGGRGGVSGFPAQGSSDMDVASIAAAVIAAQASQLQLAVAAKMLCVNAQSGADAVASPFDAQRLIRRYFVNSIPLELGSERYDGGLPHFGLETR